jgi:3D-(3,5/4)-trihydroxycyclohexane-1,2-dione acylhydrolase (decyclizing)
MTMAQALVAFLEQQFVERDGREHAFFGGCFGIFGHGNVAGIGQALQEHPRFRYYQARNEQGMVHAAAAFAKMNNRMRAMACTASIGPGATNMVTAAAGATINRLPVLLLPGDVFARRNVDPVLQQLECPWTRDMSVNDCFRPVSRYWDRIWRPEQLPSALMEAMRVLTSPADTGAVTLCLPQDVQTEAWDFPEALFERRVWRIARPVPEPDLVREGAALIQSAKRPLIIAGGGVLYSEAQEALSDFAAKTGIPVAETQAGKGSLAWDHPQCLGAMGATGSLAANRIAASADLVVGIGTRYSDFTTASQTAFQNPLVRFVNINVAPTDTGKQAGLPLLADAKLALGALADALGAHEVSAEYRQEIAGLTDKWHAEVDRLFAGDGSGGLIAQAEVVGLLNEIVGATDVIVCAAGSLPGDLHKLWRSSDPKSYHAEYGYSCMGYEIAGALGVKMADPERQVWALVGDASYLMMSQEIVTAVQEGLQLNVVLIDNHGFSSIGGLSEAVGSSGFGTAYRFRDDDGQLTGAHLPLDFVKNAESLGALAIRATGRDAVRSALRQARENNRTTVVVIETDREKRVPSYDSWWDVPVAEVSSMQAVQQARQAWEESVTKERAHLSPGPRTRG